LGAATPGELVVEPPTLTCAGFHWEITDDGGDNASAAIEYRKVGDPSWRKGMDFMRTSIGNRFTGAKHCVAGSLFNLEPGTRYEAKLTLTDPDGVEGQAERTVQFTTRSAPKLPAGGTTYHVYPPDHRGFKAGPLLGDGDWRAALADSDASPLRPGDVVAMHAGTYPMGNRPEATVKRPVAQVSAGAPRAMPEGGTTWHVYPVGHKGQKLSPTIKLNHYNTPILDKDRKTGKQKVRPGDTVLFHAGLYKVNKHNYRDRLFQGPKWGVWWFWGGGEAGKPVVFKAAGDGEVVFDGSGNYAIFQLAATDHIRLDGLIFRNAQCALLAGMKGLEACEGLTVANCRFENVQMPIYADTPTKDWRLADNKGLDVVHAGPWHEAFGCIDVRVDGADGKPIVIRPAGDGEVLIEGGDRYAVFDVTHGDHVWIKDLKLRNTECAVMTGLYPFGKAPDGLIVTGLHAEDVRMGVYGDESTGERWYIADNTIIGRSVGKMGMNNHISPFGINVCGRGHVVAHNHLEWFQDGIDLGWWDRSTSYDADDYTASVDVVGNFVFGSGDNSLEADGSYFNGRFFENAFLTCNSPSTQSTPGGPYYFIRNIFYNGRTEVTFKLPSSIIAVHNLFGSNLNLGRYSSSNNRFVNNLFVFAPGRSRARRGKPDLIAMRQPARGGMSDYNGFRVVREALAEKPFAQGDKEWGSLEAYAKATGEDTHSVRVPGYQELFVNVPEPQRDDMHRLEGLDFRLKPGTPAVDAGTVVPNISEPFHGKAPDLGPIELGDPMPHYGPRESR
jgi:hypothetical protein